jgi:hypothetical protein
MCVLILFDCVLSNLINVCFSMKEKSVNIMLMFLYCKTFLKGAVLVRLLVVVVIIVLISFSSEIGAVALFLLSSTYYLVF